MPSRKRHKTDYKGVYYIVGKALATGKRKGEGKEKTERIYYIVYRKDGRLIEEKAGRQYADDMTPAKAARLRTLRMQGDDPTNKERRRRLIEERNKKKWDMDALWEEYKKNKPDLRGLHIDDNRYKLHIRPKLGDKKPSELSPFNVDGIRVEMLKKYKPQTVKHVLGLINRIVNFGVSKKLCKPLSFKIEMPKVDNLKTEDLTPEQLNRLLKAIEDEPNIQIANLLRMALYTGMRRGELLRLQWRDIDFKRGFIHIRNPKGGKSQTIPLNDKARRVLESHPRTESEYVFPGKNGGPRVNIRIPINRIKERAGLPKDFRPLHGLRHVYASMLASSGRVDMYTLQKLLTHKSPQMTQRYAHLRDEALKRASNLIGSLVEEAIADVAGEEEKKSSA